MIAELPAPCSGGCAQHCLPPLVRVGTLAVDTENMNATVNGQRVHLTPTEARLLCYLASHVGALCRRHDIVRAVWYSGPGPLMAADYHNLRTNMSRLRAALGPAGVFVETNASLGFRLTDSPYTPTPRPIRMRTSHPRLATPRPSFGDIQWRMLQWLKLAPDRRCSITALSRASHQTDRGDRRAEVRYAVARLQARGIAITLEHGPGPEYGWVTLTERVEL